MAIAVSVGIIAGMPKESLLLLAGGAVLPDMDTSRSTIGRIFFPNWIAVGFQIGPLVIKVKG